MPDLKEEFQINPAEIRTMQKDIARLQRGGPQIEEEISELEKPLAAPAPAPIPLKEEGPGISEEKKIEILRKAEEEKKRIEEEEKKREEEYKKTEEEAKRKEKIKEEDEKIKIEKEKTREEERKRMGEERRIMAEEERKRREWQLRKAEDERRRILETQKEEERIAVEEIRRGAKEEAKKEETRLAPQILKQEKAEIRKEIRSLRLKSGPLEEKRLNLFSQKQNQEKSLKPILNEEKQVEEKIKSLEKREKDAQSAQQREEIEKTRWQMEEQRRKIEVQRWEKEKQIQEIDLTIKEINLKIQEVHNEIKALKSKLAIIKKKENRIKLAKERKISQKALEELRIKEIQPLQFEKNKLTEKLNEVEGRLKRISDREGEAKKEKEVLEEHERLAQNPLEKRDIEKQRWEKENEIKKIEGQRWGIEKEKEKIILVVKEINIKLNYILKKEEGLKKKIEEINKFLIEIPQRPASEKIKAVPSQIRELIPEKVEPPKIPSRRPESAKIPNITGGIKEKIMVLKEKRRAFEAEEEKKRFEKISQIKSKLMEIQKREEEERKDFLEKIKIQEKEGTPLKSPKLPQLGPSGKKEIIFRPLPEKLSMGEKLWVRLVILFIVLIILAGLITFWYWYAVIRPKNLPENPEENPPFEQLPVIPTALIPIENLPTLEASLENEIPVFISQIINAEFQEEEIFRVLIVNKSRDKFVGLEEFLTAFNVETPENFYEKLNDDFTLFVHSANIGNRLGFIVKIENQENLANLMTSWEVNVENNTASLFAVLGKEEKALLSYFKSGQYQNISFRCQPFSSQDLGICWSIIEDKLIWTTSWNTMEKIIDIIKSD